MSLRSPSEIRRGKRKLKVDLGDPRDLDIDPLKFTRPERVDAFPHMTEGMAIAQSGLIQCPNCHTKFLMFVWKCSVCGYKLHKR